MCLQIIITNPKERVYGFRTVRDFSVPGLSAVVILITIANIVLIKSAKNEWKSNNFDLHKLHITVKTGHKL